MLYKIRAGSFKNVQDYDIKPIFQPSYVKDTLKEIKWQKFYFPSKEVHIKVDSKSFYSDCEEIQILTTLHRPGDLEELLLLMDALKRVTVKLDHPPLFELVVPFWPGARQDRVTTLGEPITTAVYAEVINQLDFNRVIIFDPHSNVTEAVIKNVEVISNNDFICEVIEQIQYKGSGPIPGTHSEMVTLVAPDLGASKKVQNLHFHLKNRAFNHISSTVSENIIQCTKQRDTRTGQLSNFSIVNPIEDVEGKDLIIVDDICDGGGTFLALAQLLKEQGARKIYLAVSHGLFTRSIIYEDSSIIDYIYTTCSVGYTIPTELTKKIKYIQYF